MRKPAPDLNSIVARAVELDSPADRDRSIADARRDEAEAAPRGDAESLFHADAGADAGQSPASHAFSTFHPDELEAAEPPSQVIDAYKLLEQIGEGGMGVVYMAEQMRPIQRKVALKVIKPGMSSRQVIARFEAERQALALMDHPNIAKVFDAGATITGRPYFVMELVKGLPITEYCDRAQLTPRERIELFTPVCQAIQHAHQKGIIHRDIKPSNVMISLYDGKPVPKVIDFGVAKAIDQRLTERTLYTQHGAIIGTLEYMSPEQAENSALDIDTRSDIYSLGVLLYELLTGTTPLERHRLRQAGYSEVLRRIREEDAPKPSSRLSKTDKLAAIAAGRNTEPAKLARLVRGDLDWIAIKALEKDRDRRYATANDLARDLERYLAGDPVEAAAPSTGYRVRKYVGRHFAALVMAAAFVTVLVAATAVSAWQAVVATQQQARARDAENDAKGVLRFLSERVLSAARPEAQEGGLGREITLRQALDAAELSITDDFANQPNVESAIRDTLGTSYLYLGEQDAAIRQFERAMALRQRTLGPDAPDTLKSMDVLGVAYRKAGREREAIPLLEKVLARRKATLGPEHRDTMVTLNNLGVAYFAARRIAEAIPLLDQVCAYSRKELGPRDPETLTRINNLAAAYKRADRLDEAIALYEEVLALRKETLAPDHGDTLYSLNNLAAAYQLVGRTSEAISMLEEVIASRKAMVGADHPSTLASMSNLAQAVRGTDRAVRLLEEVLAKRRQKPPPGNADVLRTLYALADAQIAANHLPDAEATLRESLALHEKHQPRAWTRYQAMSRLGACLAAQKKFADAEPFLIDGYEGLIRPETEVPPGREKEVTAAAARIAPFYDAWRKPDEAERWRRKLATPAPAQRKPPH